MHQRCEFAGGGAAVDGVGGQWNGSDQMIRSACGDQGRRGIQQHNIPPRRLFSTENRANDSGIVRRVSTRDGIESGAAHAKFFRSDFVSSDRSLAHFGNAGWTGDGDFVQTIAVRAPPERGAIPTC